MSETTIIETAELSLREMSAADLDFIAEMLCDAEVMAYWPRPHTRDEAREWIERQQDRYAEFGYGYWLVIDRKNSVPVGQVGLLPQVIDEQPITGLGYIMHRGHWRKGYAYRAAEACLDYAFDTLKTSEIIAAIRPENGPSRELATRLGFEPGITTKYANLDHTLYRMTSEMWKERKGESAA